MTSMLSFSFLSLKLRSASSMVCIRSLPMLLPLITPHLFDCSGLLPRSVTTTFASDCAWLSPLPLREQGMWREWGLTSRLWRELVMCLLRGRLYLERQQGMSGRDLPLGALRGIALSRLMAPASHLSIDIACERYICLIINRSHEPESSSKARMQRISQTWQIYAPSCNLPIKFNLLPMFKTIIKRRSLSQQAAQSPTRKDPVPQLKDFKVLTMQKMSSSQLQDHLSIDHSPARLTKSVQLPLSDKKAETLNHSLRLQKSNPFAEARLKSRERHIQKASVGLPKQIEYAGVQLEPFDGERLSLRQQRLLSFTSESTELQSLKSKVLQRSRGMQ